MKYKELKKFTKKLQNNDSKVAIQALLDNYKINGVQPVVDSNVLELTSDKNNEYNIVCNHDDKFYLLHGKKDKYASVDKYEVFEKPNISVDNSGYKELYDTVIRVTGYKDDGDGITIEEISYYKDCLNNDSFVKDNYDKYKISYDILKEKLPGLGLHLYDYEKGNDPILKKWSLNSFVEYFLNNDLDHKLRKINYEEKDNTSSMKK